MRAYNSGVNRKALAHFKKSDKKLYGLILKLKFKTELVPIPPGEYFAALCESIVSQQLSVKVSDVIYARFVNLLKGKKVTSANVLKISDEKIRKAGISQTKVSYIKDLAAKIASGNVNLSKVHKMTNEQVIRELTKVKGIGIWTAEMFLMFSLGREDIFSFGDLGLKNAIKKLYDEERKEEVEKIILKWSPYKTYACRVLWRSLDNQ